MECGENSWTSVVAPCTSFLASHDLRVHFGLGDQTSVDRIVVFWPDGPVEECAEVFAGGPVDRDRTLRRGTGTGMRTTP
ncbi:MAG: ASPIC/UnbV domain-containing protein [Fuerstiella sp.]